jgi:anti-sigma-K factor RskA
MSEHVEQMSGARMNTRDLLELASLDALGLLDEDERRQFEAAFQAASPALRAQVRREQARTADLSDILPRAEAPAGLRARVLAAVGEAIAAVGGSRDENDVVARLEARHFAMRGYVTPLWRAACIGFATATVVLLGVGYSMHSDYQRTYQAFRSSETAAQLARDAGPKFADFIAQPDTQRFALRTVSDTAGPSRTAAVYINPQTREGVLYCKGLKGYEGEFRLVLIDESGKVASVLARFESKGEAEFKSLESERIRELAPGMKMAITVGDTPADAAQPLMVSTL